MAGLYIRNVKLPESAFNTLYLAVHQDGTVEYDGGPYGWQTTRATPVPDHGRLVDADALVLKGYALSVIRSGSYGTWRDDVPLIDTDAAPTIIPADKDGDA